MIHRMADKVYLLYLKGEGLAGPQLGGGEPNSPAPPPGSKRGSRRGGVATPSCKHLLIKLFKCLHYKFFQAILLS